MTINREQKTILCLFDYACMTGFATVSQNIVPRIKAAFGAEISLHICAINYFGEPYTDKETGSMVFPASKLSERSDDFGRYGFMELLMSTNIYDGIFIIQDLGIITPIIPLLQKIKEEKKKKALRVFKSMYYFPVDHDLQRNHLTGIEFFDTIVTYTEYAKAEVIKARPDLKGKVGVVLHGVNTDQFYPTDASEFRKQYFGANSEKYIIMNLNRNQPRKDIPNTIFGFIEAKKRWKDDNRKPFLYLHMAKKDPMGWDLEKLLSQTSLVEGEDYMFPPQEIQDKGAPVETINLLYNAVDVYLTTTLGEGFGLGFIEAAATKLPIICPFSTSFEEMSDNGTRSYVLNELIPCCNTIDNVIRPQTNAGEVGDTILYVYANNQKADQTPVHLDSYRHTINNAYRWATDLSWDNVCKQWENLFRLTYFH